MQDKTCFDTIILLLTRSEKIRVSGNNNCVTALWVYVNAHEANLSTYFARLKAHIEPYNDIELHLTATASIYNTQLEEQIVQYVSRNVMVEC